MPADLGRVDPGLGGEQVHRPLDGGGGLGPPGAPVGADRRGVGDDRRWPTPRPAGMRVRARRHQDRQRRQERRRSAGRRRCPAGSRSGRRGRCRPCVPPIVILCCCARPWVIAEQVLRTGLATSGLGRPSSPATQATTTACSASAPNFAPNAPPTSGVMIRIIFAARRRAGPASAALGALRALVGDPGRRAARPRPRRRRPSGTPSGPRRPAGCWMASLTTTSHPSNRSGCASPRIAERADHVGAGRRGTAGACRRPARRS